jgi:acylphosphatase
VEAEGAPDTVKAFVVTVEERLHGYIRKTERQGAKRPPQFVGFTIR